MHNVNHFIRKRIYAYFVAIWLILFSAWLTVLKYRQAEQLSQAVSAVVTIRGYQGLIFDGNGIGSILVGILESDQTQKVKKISLKKNGTQGFTRDYTSFRGSLLLNKLLDINIEQSLDEFSVDATLSLTPHELLKALTESGSLALVLFTGLKMYLVYLSRKKNLAFTGQLAAMAEQVAHDIRSPLSALEMVSSQLAELSEEKRIIIRNSINRIRDIANSLSIRNKTDAKLDFDAGIAKKNGDSFFEVVLLSPVIEAVVTEKRLQYRNHLGIDLSFNQSRESYGLFAKISITEFERAISNLIDNGVEALIGLAGKVEIAVSSNKEVITILISDTGKGIPADTLEKLGVRGATYGKEGGSGLGLAHALELFKRFGGDIKIDSQVNVGTRISLMLLREADPAWFVPKLILIKGQCVVVFDDDQTIHQIWKGRLNSLITEGGEINLHHMSSSESFRRFYRINFADLENAIFLMDYEIIGQSETGLDIIEELGIQSQSILVTSRYEEPRIRERCGRGGIRIIPKSMSGFVPIEISKA